MIRFFLVEGACSPPGLTDVPFLVVEDAAQLRSILDEAEDRFDAEQRALLQAAHSKLARETPGGLVDVVGSRVLFVAFRSRPAFRAESR